MSADSKEPTAKRGIPRRKLFQLAAGTGLTIVGTELAFPHIPFDTDPYNLRDSTLWRLFRGPSGGIMRLCGADDKDSNYWQWGRRDTPTFEPSARIKGNFQTFVRNGTLDNIRMSCDGIHEIYVLNPKQEITWRIMYQTVKEVQPGSYEPYESQVNYFSGKLKGPVKFLRGNGDVNIYATDEDGKRIDLEVTGPFQREDPNVPGKIV